MGQDAGGKARARRGCRGELGAGSLPGVPRLLGLGTGAAGFQRLLLLPRLPRALAVAAGGGHRGHGGQFPAPLARRENRPPAAVRELLAPRELFRLSAACSEG